MWQTLKLWLAAAAIGAAGMVLLLFVVGTLTSLPDRPGTADIRNESEDPEATQTDDSCSFRIFGSVVDEFGNAVEAVTISLRGDGPFATSNRAVVSNSSGRFVYLESGYSACVLEDLYITVNDPANRFREWSRPEPVRNDEQLRVVLDSF